MQIKVKQKLSSDKDSMVNPDSGRQSWSEHLGLDGLACLVPLGCAALLVTNKLLRLSSPPYTRRWLKDKLESSLEIKVEYSTGYESTTSAAPVTREGSKSFRFLSKPQMLRKSVPSFQNLGLLAKKLWLLNKKFLNEENGITANFLFRDIINTYRNLSSFFFFTL